MKPSPAADLAVLRTVTDCTRALGLPPHNPLIHLFDLAAHRAALGRSAPTVTELYSIVLKRGVKGTVHYGHQAYDFGEGVLAFTAPGQVVAAGPDVDTSAVSGWSLVFHPDLLRKYPLGPKMAGYGFFAYQVHEALHLSATEEQLLDGVLRSVQHECAHPIDAFSYDMLVSQLEVLLNYANRFYHRQFLTRRVAEHDVLSRFEALLTAHFAQPAGQPLPTVQGLAAQLHVSPDYLGDMLRVLTGQSTQQHIHQALIEKAKQLLLGTPLSSSETAFQLGFEYPHYFTRLFSRRRSSHRRLFAFQCSSAELLRFLFQHV